MYNILLARMPPVRDELPGELEESFAQWRNEILARQGELVAWDISAMWTMVATVGGRVTPQTKRFVDAWFDLFKSVREPNELLASTIGAKLIIAQEHRLKRHLARLTNDDARRRWNGASGLGRLEYRWGNARMVLNDIVAARGADA
jgi:hypothetical protein